MSDRLLPDRERLHDLAGINEEKSTHIDKARKELKAITKAVSKGGIWDALLQAKRQYGGNNSQPVQSYMNSMRDLDGAVYMLNKILDRLEKEKSRF